MISWIGYLALFAFLWCKLPGLRTQEEGKASSRFRITPKAQENDVLVIATEAAKLVGFSERAQEISIQKLERKSGKWSVTGDPMRSQIQVEMVSPRIAEVRGLGTDMQDLLRSGPGQYAVVMGNEEQGEFSKLVEMIIESVGSGVWKILKSLMK
ncbi:MAG: hypothetical protein JW850_12415 [Thermoflexales bacterium]|nr:hypothetical protein [Thermoflexales bacterium]